mgnify:CR=1 FL=1
MSVNRKRFRIEQAILGDAPIVMPAVEGGEIGPMHREIMAELRAIPGLTAFPSDTACTAAVELEGATLDLRGSELSVNLGARGNCAVGVVGARVTGQALTLAARASRISGAEKSNPSDPAAQIAAVCLANAQSVLLEDSSLTDVNLFFRQASK